MIIKILSPSAVTLHWPLAAHFDFTSLLPRPFLVLGYSFFTARVFLVEISQNNRSFISYIRIIMQNISDCSIREYRSIVAFVTRNGSACHPTIYTYKDGYFTYVN